MSVIWQTEESTKLDKPIVIRLYEEDEPQYFAEGGLARAAEMVRSGGEMGDDILLHVNPEEFEQIKAAWGEPTFNDHTGLPEYGLKRLFKKVGKGVKRVLKNPLVQKLAPIAMNMFLPGVGGLIGSSLFGALSAKESGGNPLLGGLTGALGHGFGGVGKGATNVLSKIMPGESGGMPTGSAGTGVLSKLKGFFTNEAGKPAWGKIAGAGVGALGLLSSMKGGNSDVGTAPPPSTPPLQRLAFERNVTGLPRQEDYATYGTTGGEHQFFDNNRVPMIPETPMRAGGHYIQGPGSGRSDDIDAKLSNNEYVMDAETVALLGDGSPDEGARRLDELRANIRRHKGQQLAKGKFSANAKRPEEYLAKGGKVKPRYVIEALRTKPRVGVRGKTTDMMFYEELDEGPWDSRRDAERFLEAEVGAPGARVREKKAKGGRPRWRAPQMPAGDKSQAHRGYYIKHNPMRDEFYISKDNTNIGGAYKSIEEAKKEIDGLLDYAKGGRIRGDWVRRVVPGGMPPKTAAERQAELEAVQRFLKAYKEQNPQRPPLKVVKAKGGAVKNMTRFADELEQAIQSGNSDRITQIAAQMDTLSPKSSEFFKEGFAKGGSAKNLLEQFMDRLHQQSQSQVPIDQVVEELRRMNPGSKALSTYDNSGRYRPPMNARKKSLQGEELLRMLEKER